MVVPGVGDGLGEKVNPPAVGGGEGEGGAEGGRGDVDGCFVELELCSAYTLAYMELIRCIHLRECHCNGLFAVKEGSWWTRQCTISSHNRQGHLAAAEVYTARKDCPGSLQQIVRPNMITLIYLAESKY